MKKAGLPSGKSGSKASCILSAIACKRCSARTIQMRRASRASYSDPFMLARSGRKYCWNIANSMAMRTPLARRASTHMEIAKLHKILKVTFVCVTHDQIEAMTLVDKIVVINEGRIEHTEEPLALYYKPNNLFVAGFIGSRP